jgi:isochorismate synthase
MHNSPLEPKFSTKKNTWLNYHAQAVSALENTDQSIPLEKVVLARTKLIELTPSDLLQRINHHQTNNYCFLMAPNADTSFLSQSPEQLFRSKHQDFTCDCIGGTLWETSHLENTRTQTIQHEHDLIVQDILARLETVTNQKPLVSEQSILRLNNISHYKAEVKGTLKVNHSALDLLQLLHPTAAVGGFPRSSALDFIRRNEGFNRGWYAAPLGCIYNDVYEFAVGIRSILAYANFALAYAGCGVVAGSHALDEWEETSRKFLSFGA